MHNYSNSELVKIGVANKQISQYLYKYRSIEATKMLIDNNSLWFPSPKEFNDPFDCQILPNSDNSETEIRNFLTKNAPDLSPDEIKKIAMSVVKEPNKWKKIIESIFEKTINATGVCCFTKKATNLLMWSHYADSHKGVCLKFDILQDPDFFVIPLPVKYREDYPDYNHLGDRETLVHDIVLSKSANWSYEDEVRVLKMNKNGLIEFRKESLIEIIFGCNAKEKDIKEIIGLSNQKNFKIKFRKTEKKYREFGLNVIDL